VLIPCNLTVLPVISSIAFSASLRLEVEENLVIGKES
jgi:hypothetical protein